MVPVKQTVSTHDWLERMANEAPLAMIFRGRSRDEWKRWRSRWLAKLTELMGKVPQRVPISSEVVDRVELERYTREKILYEVDHHSTVPAYVLAPNDIARGDRRPAVLCAHGHDGLNVGKEAVAGVDGDQRVRETIAAYNYDYARQLALRGYITIVPNWRAFGERYDRSSVQGRDPCNLLQNSVSWLGYNLLTLDVFDAKAAIDYLEQRSDVDPERIGMMGLSYGGRVTTFTAALEPRIRTAVVSGALNCFVERIKSRGSCGSQVVPGLLLWGDIPEVLGLIAPRPLFIERGTKDGLLPVDYFEEGYRRLRRIYEAAGASGRLCREEFEGGHRFHGVGVYEWLERWLRS